MKIIKYKAFTLSELMVLMAILTVLFAAFAPVFTVRYNNASSDYVWSFVQDDTNGNAYTDELNKSLLAESFIGISPMKPTDITSKYAPYSKLIIRGSDSLANPQAQIDFRYGDNDEGNGELVSSLLAGNGNFLIGGPFRSITSQALSNTAFGVRALKNITDGSRNTAVGFQALYELTTGNDNTAIGMNAGNANVTGSQNTMIGYHAGQCLGPACSSAPSGSYNTLVGNYVMSGAHGSYNSIVGAYAAQWQSGNYNTILGSMSMINYANPKFGSYNTTVGAYTLMNNSGDYNTAIGYNSCNLVTGSNKTCIGGASGKASESGYSASYISSVANSNILSDNAERIFIGGRPNNNYTDGHAVLEVHNVDGTHGSHRGGNVGNATVLINGNLVIRGQTFMKAHIGHDHNHGGLTEGNVLASFHISHPKNGTWSHIIGGYTGQHETEELRGDCKRPDHEQTNGFGACLCAGSDGDNNGITSYDWASSGEGNGYAKDNFTIGGRYYDQSTNKWINKGSGGADDDVIVDYAHAFNGENTCCPYLKSDARLKNIGTEFTGGLNEINKLKVYNYTYKNDRYKLPHVGVIAQDLKRIFPTAVTKAVNGYYKIRWDEIFYSAINAVKELNSKIDTLALRVKDDIERVNTLKKDNVQLKKQLDVLSQELSALEK